MSTDGWKSGETAYLRLDKDGKTFAVLQGKTPEDNAYVWRVKTADSGKTYYINQATQDKNWELPDPVGIARKAEEKKAAKANAAAVGRAERETYVRPKTDMQREIDPFYVQSIDDLRTVFAIYTNHYNTEVVTSYMLTQLVEALVPNAQKFLKDEARAKLFHISSEGRAGFVEFEQLIRHVQRGDRLTNKALSQNCIKEVQRMQMKREMLVNKSMLGKETDALNSAIAITIRNINADGKPLEPTVASINERLLAALADKDAKIVQNEQTISKLNAKIDSFKPNMDVVQAQVEQVNVVATTAAVKKAGVKGKKSAASDSQPAASNVAAAQRQEMFVRGGRPMEDVLNTARQLAAEARGVASSRGPTPGGGSGGFVAHSANNITASSPSAAMLFSPVRSYLHTDPNGSTQQMPRTFESYAAAPAASSNHSGWGASNAIYRGSQYSNLTDTLLPSMPVITAEDVNMLLADKRPLRIQKLQSTASTLTPESATAGTLITNETTRMGGAYHVLGLEKRKTQQNVKYLPIHGCHHYAFGPPPGVAEFVASTAPPPPVLQQQGAAPVSSAISGSSPRRLIRSPQFTYGSTEQYPGQQAGGAALTLFGGHSPKRNPDWQAPLWE